MQNPVKHGLVQRAEDYPWCSMSWYKESVDIPFYKTVTNFKFDKLTIKDEFKPQIRNSTKDVRGLTNAKR